MDLEGKLISKPTSIQLFGDNGYYIAFEIQTDMGQIQARANSQGANAVRELKAGDKLVLSGELIAFPITYIKCETLRKVGRF